MPLHRSYTWVLFPVALSLLGTGCTRATGYCQLDADCAAGLLCSPATSTCQAGAGTGDLGSPPDMPAPSRLGTRLPSPAGSLGGDYFGTAVAATSSFLVVGSYLAKGGQGLAYVADVSAATVGPYTPLASADAPVGYDYFGIAVAAYGNTLVIGASNKDAGKGAVYVYTRQGAGWSAPTKLVAADGVVGDYFGSAVSLYGDTLAVGAAYKGGTLGAAYVFTRNLQGLWSASLRLSPPQDGTLLPADYFGQQVAAHTNYVAVAAPGRTLNRGAVYLYKYDAVGLKWNQTSVGPLAVGAATGEQFGSALTMSPTTLAIGSAAFSSSPQLLGQGNVSVYSLETPGAPMTLTTPDPGARDRFGAALALIPPTPGSIPETLVVGAPGRNQAFLYHNVATWQRAAVLEAPPDGAHSGFGSSVATTGLVHLVGTRGIAQEVGSAYLFSDY